MTGVNFAPVAKAKRGKGVRGKRQLRAVREHREWERRFNRAASQKRLPTDGYSPKRRKDAT